MLSNRTPYATLLAAAVLALGCADERMPRGEAPPRVEVPPATHAPSAKPGPEPPPTLQPAAGSAGFEPRLVRLEEGAMGTRIVIQSFTTPALDDATLKSAMLAALEEIRRLEALMTTWREDSEVSRINAAAGRGPVAIGPETFAVLEKSLWIAERSEGTFDITFEAMKGLWKFDEDKSDAIPSQRAIDAARKKIDWRKLGLDPAARTAELREAGMRINLGGIAKGYAVDRAAAVLEQRGLRAFYVQAGGDLYVRGKKPDGSRFRVGVRDPRGKHDLDHFAMIEVEDHAFSTAGDYERSFVRDGKRYHHIIDPRTGWPATRCRSVTVWAKDAFTADAIDDAVFILGPEKGLALVESIEDAGAVIVDGSNEVWVSRRLEPYLKVYRKPTDAP
jgi:thiamine biosynthesis lipoprotein